MRQTKALDLLFYLIEPVAGSSITATKYYGLQVLTELTG
jgi:hypothetical protein